MSTEFDLALQRAFQIVNDAAKQSADIMMAAQLAETQALTIPAVRYIPPERVTWREGHDGSVQVWVREDER